VCVYGLFADCLVFQVLGMMEKMTIMTVMMKPCLHLVEAEGNAICSGKVFQNTPLGMSKGIRKDGMDWFLVCTSVVISWNAWCM
jgi:hypothetical protein